MKAISPRLKAIIYTIGAVVVLAAISVLVWYLLNPRYYIEAEYVSAAPKIDGKLNEAAWINAETLVVPVEKGPDIELKAVYTSDMVFVSARYPDATKDVIYQPWIFDGKAWKSGRKADSMVLFFESGDSIKDFDTKGFNIMDPGFGSKFEIYQFSMTKKRQSTGYAPGYQGRADIWIMGAGATSPFGQADDAWFGVDANYLFSPAGREANLITQWDQFTTPGTIRINTVLWQEATKVSEGGSADSALTQDGPYLMYKDKTMNLENTPYPVESQLIPISDGIAFNKGDMLPSLYFGSGSPGHWGGSRDDVAGRMAWKDGWWSVEMSRKLNTGNDDDTVFKTGEEDHYHFGIVVRRDGKTNRYSIPATLEFAPKGGG